MNTIFHEIIISGLSRCSDQSLAKRSVHFALTNLPLSFIFHESNLFFFHEWMFS